MDLAYGKICGDGIWGGGGGGGIWAVGTMGIQDQAQSTVNGQGETELDNDQNQEKISRKGG